MANHMTLSLVHLYFVPATCCRKCTQDSTTLLSLILSLRLIAAKKFCRSDNDFYKIKRVTQGELLRRLVPATCHLAPVAQLVEHRAAMREVVSSTPAGPTTQGL